MAYLHTGHEISRPQADLNDVNPAHVFATVKFGRSYFTLYTAAEAEAFAAAFSKAARLLREAAAAASEPWTCRDCGGQYIGQRTPDDLCATCLSFRLSGDGQ